MITQTLALFLDAYRELNSRRLFWVTLIISGVVILAFAMVGYNARGLTIAMLQTDFPSSLYKGLVFSTLVVGLWLTWGATILALVSTAGIFPDLIRGGAIELYLARPIGRARLFFTKYLCGLLFVTLQVTLFSFGSFLVMGLRGHSWMPSLFLAIPIVVLMFSYVFAVSVLVGVWTRSTVAALLIAIIVWGAFSLMQRAEGVLLVFRVQYERRIVDARRTLDDSERQLEVIKQHPTQDMLGLRAGFLRQRRDKAIADLPRLESELKPWRISHRVAYGFRLVVPKTKETTDLLDRWIMTDDEAGAIHEEREQRLQARGHADAEEQEEAMAEMEGIRRHRSTASIVLTSLLDELLMIGIAAWMFCRRDY